MDLAAHIDRVVKRSKAFLQKEEPGHYLINAEIPADTHTIPPLHEFDLDRQLIDWLDINLDSARPGWRIKEGLDAEDIVSLVRDRSNPL
jgi:hypothetical protein